MKYPPSYEHWDDEQRIKYEDRALLIRGIVGGLTVTVLGICIILLLATLGDIVFGWTA